jgi:hypothetical protein
MKNNINHFHQLSLTVKGGLLLIVTLLLSVVEVQSQELSCVGEAGKLQWLIYETSNSNITRNHFYPQNPSRVVIINKLETERNYTDNYISIIKGFLKVPADGKYDFNITGNAEADFYLSSDETPENAVLLVEAPSTGYAEYDLNASQTDSVDLVVGKYYYFEVLHRETSGSDHARVSWKIPGDTAVWKTIAGEYLYQYTCNEICDDKGTPCDDGNAQTTGDREDGACNCFGTPVDAPACVGEYGQALALYYDGIGGTDIAQLLASPAYPLQPSRSEVLSEMTMPNRALNDSFGTMLNACLLVPVTGSYEFSVAGNTSAELYLGSSPAMDDLALLARSTGSTKTVQLNANQFYYLRLLHKENLNSEEFAALWKTPFHIDKEWKNIDGAYLYQYNCELACIPAGTPCDDGNTATINDRYDSNCRCAGTHCPNGDCPEEEPFVPYDACENTGAHGTHPDDSWLSCLKTVSPNPARGETHWIQYDIGSVMPIGTSHVWNYNVEGDTGKGFRRVIVDVSVDKNSWKEVGVYEWAQAPGENNYNGFEGPDFRGNSARYILLTGLSNWNGDECAGFSELKFTVAACPGVGTPCNDNNAETINDRYGADCQCKGDEIVSAGFEEQTDGLKVFPNPVDGWANVVFYLAEETTVDLKVYDVNGRLIVTISNSQPFRQGFHQKSVTTHNLLPGNYIVVLKTTEKVITEKLIKIK